MFVYSLRNKIADLRLLNLFIVSLIAWLNPMFKEKFDWFASMARLRYLDIQVVGVPDDITGEEVCACVRCVNQLYYYLIVLKQDKPQKPKTVLV